ncbi:MAG TPA: DUF4157 domain-containing protein [Candidatus Limnocylindrales bacterium]|nr:DUF4157 domain-containing protein [Candidatus Limnocylindrales bacterium]
MSSQTATATRTAAPAPAVAAAPPTLHLQRQCQCGQHTLDGAECTDCRGKRTKLLRRENARWRPAFAPPLVGEVLRSPGRPLDTSIRTVMERRFGQDFSSVRVHADASAAESARAVNARAYTLGNRIVFGARQYVPSTHAGQKLLAHELAHVVQQGRSNPQILHSHLEVGPAHDPLEQEAEARAEAVMNGRSAGAVSFHSSTTGPARIQRTIGDALEAVGTFLLDVALFIPRLFGLEFFTARDLREYLASIRHRRGPDGGLFSDNKARALVNRENEFGPYSTQDKIWMIQDMLQGHTSFLDERAIITLMRRSVNDRSQIVAALGRDYLWSKFDGRNRRILEALTMTTADAGDALVARLRSLSPEEIQDYSSNATEPTLLESFRRATSLSMITAPIPATAAINQRGEASFTINGIAIIAGPDRIVPAHENHAFTALQLQWGAPEKITVTPENTNQPVGPFAPTVITGTIWSEFSSEEAKSKSSGYGVGTRPQDTDTLRFHERAHGEAWMRFLQENQPPVFTGTQEMLPAQFNAAIDQWTAAMRAYAAHANDFAMRAGDCVGRLPTDEQLAGTGYTAAICHQL